MRGNVRGSRSVDEPVASVLVAWQDTGDGELRALAPDAFDAFDGVGTRVRSAADPLLVELTCRHVARLLGTTEGDLGGDSVLSATAAAALAGWPSAPGLSGTERICIDMAEQF